MMASRISSISMHLKSLINLSRHVFGNTPLSRFKTLPYSRKSSCPSTGLCMARKGSASSEYPPEISSVWDCGLVSVPLGHRSDELTLAGQVEEGSATPSTFLSRRVDNQPISIGTNNVNIHKYYQATLDADPCNPLVLSNYATFLHEAEGDLQKAEEYCQRAIVAMTLSSASTVDGHLLNLYAGLMWELHHDSHRAHSYFEQAMHASPDDCYVLGSYAHFLWCSEDGEEEMS